MGLSKLFPCCRKPKPKPQAQEPPPGTETNGASSNAKTPPATDIPSESSNNAEAPEQEAAEILKQEAPAKAQDTPELNISQKVWNRAYDELAEDEATKSLVEDYMMAVQKANKPDEDASMSEIQGNMTKMDSQAEREKILRDTVQSGKEKIYKSTKLTNAVGGVSEFVLKFKSVIDLAVGTNPQAALPWAGVCIGLQFLLNPSQESKANEDGIGYVISRMEWYCSLTDHVLSKKNIVIGDESFEDVHRRLEERVTALYKALLLYQMKSACSYYRSQGWTFIRNIISLDDWNSQLNSVKEAEAAVEKDSKRYNEAKTQSFLGEIVRNGQMSQEILGDFHQTLQDYISSQRKKDLGQEYDNCLADLYVEDPQAQVSSIQGMKDKLIPETYNWILDTEEYKSFRDWSDKSPSRVLWLNGPAGTGKSMLMIGIIMELYEQSKQAPGISYFFCIAEEQTKNSAMDALRSLIWLLLFQQPHLISYLIQTHKRSRKAMFQGQSAFYWLRDTFKEMLADDNLHPVYLAFDALDECAEGTPGVNDLLSLVADTIEPTTKASKKVKWILSSRPEINVYDRLGHANKEAVIELDILARKEPVNAYISYKLSELQVEHNYTDSNLHKISVELRRHEHITFLWVALVLKDLTLGYIKQRKAVEYVSKTPPSLSEKYDHMLDQIYKTQDEEDKEYCMRLLEAVCLATRPLSYYEAHTLAGLPHDVTSKEIAESCGSFLTFYDNTLHILHNSARQHLIPYFESNHKGGAAHIHESMAIRSITALSTGLRYNIYALQPGTESNNINIPEGGDPLAALRYSCEFWVDHLCGPEGPREDQLLDDGAAFAFLEEHFLHWLEGLSLIHKLPTALSSIRKLITNLKKTQDTSRKFFSFLKDAERFVIRNLSIIDKAPLQTYGAALAFSPNKSEMKTRYWDERLSLIGNIAGLRNSWDPLLQTHSANSGLTSLLFSPDGRFYAATLDSQKHADGSKKGVVQLWVADTGFQTWTLTLENDKVNSVAFSPDSKLLASQSGTVVQIWNLSTGACEQRFNLKPEGTKNRNWWVGIAESIAFSKDGGALAVAIRDTVEIWDISTEQCTKTLHGHSENTRSVVFSPDGKTIASASENGIVKLWDYPLGTCLQTLEGKDPRVLMFSPNGKKLASVNATENDELDDEFNDTLTVWDLPSGTYSHTIGPEPMIQAAAFSSDSKAFAVASTFSGKIHFLDASTGAHIQNISGAGFPMDVAVSPINSLVVSASADETIHVWDTNWISEEALDCHDHAIVVVRPSPDGKTLATGSVDKTVKIWDITNRTCTKTLDGQPDRVERISFSPDGETIASATSDGSLRIWDITTGFYTQILGPTSNGGSPAIEFSKDGAVLATASCDAGGYTVKLWDPSTGTCKKTVDIDGMKKSAWRRVVDIALSSDCQTILMATAYDGGQIIDVPSGTRTHSLHSSTKPERIPGVGYPAISPDGRTCALVTSNQELELWDTATGTLRQAVPISSYPDALSFSEDGNYLKTNKGSYKLNSGFLTTSPDVELSRSALHHDGEWLVRGDQRLLWVPPDYRSRSATLGKNAVALTSVSGQLIFVEVN